MTEGILTGQPASAAAAARTNLELDAGTITEGAGGRADAA
jgi:hypothetical protein